MGFLSKTFEGRAGKRAVPGKITFIIHVVIRSVISCESRPATYSRRRAQALLFL